MKNLYTFLLVFTAIFCRINYVSAQTNVAGGNVSGTWTLAGSPYLINGSIQIPNGQTLTIEPGVTVNFQGHYKLYVQGRILAIGTVSDTITFTAQDTTVGWYGIRFDNTPSTNDSSKIIYCSLQWGIASGSGNDSFGGAFMFNNFSKAIVSNCLIKNSSSYASLGSGIYCTNSSPLISYNIISNCKNGGLYIINNSNPEISNNIISKNIGVGICIVNSYNRIFIYNNVISYNTKHGVYLSNSNAQIVYNTISFNNLYQQNGPGGIWSDNNYGRISNNIISNNLNDAAYAGGIFSYFSSDTICSNVISNNISIGSNGIGGGISIIEGAPVIFNNIISNNTVINGYGGGICSSTNNLSLVNNVIINNSAKYGGGLSFSSSLSIYNCIIYGNNASIEGHQIYLGSESTDPNFYYCDIQGGTSAFGLNGNFYTGTYQNNLDSDPLFVAPTAGSGTSYDGTTADWSLQAGSPCINAGTTDTTGLNLPLTDIAGNPRISDGRIDIGAYEHLGTSINNPITNNLINIYPNPNNGKFLLYLENYESKNYALEIYNITGQIIYSKNYENTVVLAENIDISEFESGIYLVKVNDGKKNLYKNVLICK